MVLAGLGPRRRCVAAGGVGVGAVAVGAVAGCAGGSPREAGRGRTIGSTTARRGGTAAMFLKLTAGNGDEFTVNSDHIETLDIVHEARTNTLITFISGSTRYARESQADI